jgi:CRISPR-associated protein Cmr2
MSKYIGITIGPIYDTVMMTSIPAGLWCASYMFSYISREICQKLIDEGVHCESFISPFFELENKKIKKSQNGIGGFPDRIFFKNEIISMGDVNKIIYEVKKDIKEMIPND